MRLYGSIHTGFWAETNTQRLSDQSKVLITYLLTGPHTNMLGCFRLPLGYIESDLQWEKQKVRDALVELGHASFITYDESSHWLLIHDFLKSNIICNPRQAGCIQKLFDAVPQQSTVWQPLINSLLTHGRHMLSTFIDRLLTYRHPSSTVQTVCMTDQYQNQNPEQNQNQEHEQNQNINKNKKSFTAAEGKLSTTQPQTAVRLPYKESLDFLHPKAHDATKTHLHSIMESLKSHLASEKRPRIVNQ